MPLTDRIDTEQKPLINRFLRCLRRTSAERVGLDSKYAAQFEAHTRAIRGFPRAFLHRIAIPVQSKTDRRISFVFDTPISTRVAHN